MNFKSYFIHRRSISWLNNDKKKLSSKVSKLTKELDELSAKFVTSENENLQMKDTILKYQKELKKNKERISELSKALYKFNSNDVAVDIDPYEMHKNLRLYQSKLEMSEIHNYKVEEKLKEINHIFTVLGVTLDDMKESCRTGLIKFGGLNLKNFDLSPAVPLSNNRPFRAWSKKPPKKK